MSSKRIIWAGGFLLLLVVAVVAATCANFYITRNHRHATARATLSAIIKGGGPKDNHFSLSIDRVDCKNGDWFVAVYWGISHTKSLMEEFIGDVSYGQDSFGKIYFSPHHFCGGIRLRERSFSSKQDSYENISDFFAKNKSQCWRMVE